MRRFIAVLVVLCSGCASYVTPGGPASLAVNEKADDARVEPSPAFPVKLGIVRVQAADYRSQSTQAEGRGRFRILSASEPPDAEPLRAIAQWPAVRAVATLDPELLPPPYESLDLLRLAAAKTQADLLLVYTVTTRFQIRDQPLAPLATLAIGKLGDGEAQIQATAAAVLIDVRSGYRYPPFEGSARFAEAASAWTDIATVERKRIATEQEAITALLAAGEKHWRDTVGRYQ